LADLDRRALSAAIGAFLLVDGAFAGMVDEKAFGLPGWWACAIGAVVLLISFSLLPLNVVIDPRRARAHHRGRGWLLGWVVGVMALIVGVIVGVMTLLT